MNNLLEKCVEELKADKPDLSYIRGILETLIAMSETEYNKSDTAKTTLKSTAEDFKKFAQNIGTSDEGALLDAKARASLEAVKALSEKGKNL